MMLKFRRIFEVNSLFSNILIPAVLLSLYCSLFVLVSSRTLPAGVSYYFFSDLAKIALLIAVAAGLVLLVVLQFRKDEKIELKRSSGKFQLQDLILLLLPLTPVVQYILTNKSILSLAGSIYLILLFLIFSWLCIFAIPSLLGKFMPSQVLTALGLAFVVTIANMPLLSDYFSWYEKGQLGIQLLVFVFILIATLLLYHFNGRWILHFFILINFAVNGSIQFVSQMNVKDDTIELSEKMELISRVQGKTPVITPNIYLLVYDAYVPNETMLHYGIDNHLQEDYLREQGFALYPRTYSIASNTTATMSRVLNASTDFYGNKRRAVSGDGVAQKILKDLGYKTYGLFFSDYMFRGYGQNYDHAFPEDSVPPYVQLLEAVFIGEFRFDLDGENSNSREEFVDTKQDFFANIPDGRIFVYMHTNVPTHSQTSGACLANETDLFKERLKTANLEMRRDLELILQNDPGAIVIVAGDHGPYLTKNCISTTDVYDISEISRVDIQDRYATFLAIRWPSGDFVEYDDIVVLQDIFPSVFAYMYEDQTILKAKVKTKTISPNSISGASVMDGYIKGGIDDGELLFLPGQ